MAEVARALATRGHHVVTMASARGYEDPRRRYPKREMLHGVDVRRLPLASFGKGSIALRLLGAAAFLLQVVVRALCMRRLDAILVSTSPPMCSMAALIISAIRRVPITYWVMDINPDQAIAMGAVRADSRRVRWFDCLNRLILRRASRVITLDRFMAQRLERKEAVGSRMVIIPPWAPETVTEPVEHAENPFRWQHGLADKFVVMYSGNLSLSHPLDTILNAALRLQHHQNLAFVFIGSGLGRQAIVDFIDRHHPTNVLLLPYQPLDWVRYSLSAADVHLVSMGNDMVGIVHPCKIYGALACGRPILLLGPHECHAGELLDRFDIGWQINHGDVEGAVKRIEDLLMCDPSDLAPVARRARGAACDVGLSQTQLCARVCDEIESMLPADRRLATRLAPVLPGEPAQAVPCAGEGQAPIDLRRSATVASDNSRLPS